MDLGQRLHRFYFDDQKILDYDIDAERVRKNQTFASDSNGSLSLYLKSGSCEPGSEHCLVDRLEQAWTELAMNAQPTIDCDSRKLFDRMLHGATSSRLRVFACKSNQHAPADLDLTHDNARAPRMSPFTLRTQAGARQQAAQWVRARTVRG